MRKFKESYRYAHTGIRIVFKTQRNFTIQLAIMGMAFLLAAFLGISRQEWMVLVLVSANVLVLEMINTALETAVDLVTQEYHDLAERAKDVAAGAVLLMALVSVVLGAMIFLPKILEILK
ncbi:diacylglycerol kinase family protein [Anaerotalea alkaliphila]|uniref:Diacylglycerol kinase family protein n=1 Tax=Anaerotalea alkaliphila TaxID=2662126 RepID=A0A7X5HWV3_9FIRM|nr:diacylglycerol kinase family protein [Anaerotalea alkaliphila]NDL68110.1 diacylglycerol kinase family protein [Anaerotalea alkaliphila]